jgi:hypothetical protein
LQGFEEKEENKNIYSETCQWRHGKWVRKRMLHIFFKITYLYFATSEEMQFEENIYNLQRECLVN